ncbi:hypothetical protein KW805_00620 [Candidatus Pacearchaeota archaeon]|nr:hypothetical protein [Candidatus Pacearchaeota archaeon]
MDRFLVFLLIGIVVLGVVSVSAQNETGADNSQPFIDDAAASDNGSTDGTDLGGNIFSSNSSDTTTFNPSDIFGSNISVNSTNATFSENTTNETPSVNTSDNGGIDIIASDNGGSDIMVGDVIAHTDFVVAPYTSSGPALLEVTPQDTNLTEIILLPTTAVALAESNTTDMVCDTNCTIKLESKTYNGENTLVYKVETRRPTRILGLFPATETTSVDVNAKTGEVLDVDRPWWSFLVINYNTTNGSSNNLDYTVPAGDNTTQGTPYNSQPSSNNASITARENTTTDTTNSSLESDMVSTTESNTGASGSATGSNSGSGTSSQSGSGY